jgi:hypothetical protein
MGLLKRKEEKTETIAVRVPSSLKAQLEQLRERADAAGFDLTATITEAITRLAKQVREELDGAGVPQVKVKRSEGRAHTNGLTRAGGEHSPVANSGGAES